MGHTRTLPSPALLPLIITAIVCISSSSSYLHCYLDTGHSLGCLDIAGFSHNSVLGVSSSHARVLCLCTKKQPSKYISKFCILLVGFIALLIVIVIYYVQLHLKHKLIIEARMVMWRNLIPKLTKIYGCRSQICKY